MEDGIEQEIRMCNNLPQLRKHAEERPAFKDAVGDSISPVNILLSQITQALELKGESFAVSAAAQSDETDYLWSSLSAVDSAFQLHHTDKLEAKSLTPRLTEFMSHCCRERH